MITAGTFEEPIRDACQGDSGGPLLAFDAETEQLYQTGIVVLYL